MTWFDTHLRYGSISQLLHWLIAFLLLAMFAGGWGREFLPPDYRAAALAVHKLTGILILGIAMVRVLWRVVSITPSQSSSWRARAAKGAHFLLYAMMLLMPLSGWAMTSAQGRTIIFPWIGALPSLVASDKSLAIIFQDVHETSAVIFAGLIGLHVAAACWHRFVLKDNIMARML